MPDEERPERAGVAAGVDHDPAVPLLDGHRDEPVLRPVEPVGRVEPRRRQQRAVEAVAPAVVRAVDRPVRARRSARRQLVGAVLADVVEAAQHAVVAADEQDGVVADAHGPSGPGRGELGRPSGAHPGAGEQVRSAPRPGRRRRGTRPPAACDPVPVGSSTGARSAGSTARRRRRSRLHPQRHRPTHRERASGTAASAAAGARRRGRGACTAGPGCRSRRRLRASPTSTGRARAIGVVKSA